MKLYLSKKHMPVIQVAGVMCNGCESNLLHLPTIIQDVRH